MHVENELAEIMTIGDHEFKEVIEEYEEELDSDVRQFICELYVTCGMYVESCTLLVVCW